MAGYGYPSRGYASSYNGMEPRSDQDYWTSKTSYGADGISGSDHVCRPVIIDAEGRKHPIISYNTPNESYVAKSETIIEHVQIPMVTEYKYSTSANYPPKEYGYGINKWGPKAPPSSSVYDHQRPQKVEEFIGEIQSEVSRPTPAKNSTMLSSSYWRQNPSSTGYNGGTNSGYNDDYDYSNKDWNKQQPSSYQNFNGNYRRDDIEPPMVAANGGLARPSTRPAWGSSGNDSGGGTAALSKPTNDIGAAVEYLKEVAGATTAITTTKPLSGGTTAFPQPRFTVAVPRRENYGADTSTIDSRLKRDAYTDAIDSREAARRYGNGSVNGSNRPYVAADPKAPTINSREALRKYSGTTV